MKLRTLNWGFPLIAALFISISAKSATPAPTVLFATQFEASEGYQEGFPIIGGTNGWAIFGAGGNGIVTNFFPEEGQQAFIGADASVTNDTLSVLQPINFSPLTDHQPIVKFSVLMSIEAPTAMKRDDFRWSVYNSGGVRLFSLDFDGVEHLISYLLDDEEGFISTGTTYGDSTIYDLDITMNFARNLWSATLNHLGVVNNQPITTRNSALDLGDVDAVWQIRTLGAPGDNYMLFDDYQITAEAASSIQPTIQPVSRLLDGQFLLRVFGEPGLGYIVDSTSDLVSWTPIKTVSTVDGTADFLDSTAQNFLHRFYRARQVP